MTNWWSIGEAIAWIAFRDPKPIGQWGAFARPSRVWPLTPIDDLLGPLEAIAQGAATNVGFDQSHWQLATTLASGHSVGAILKDLRSDIDKEQAFSQKVNSAFQLLDRAVRSGELAVYAVPEGSPFAKRERIDPEFLVRFPLTLHLGGAISPDRPGRRYDGPRFIDAAVDASDMQKLWPPPAPPTVQQWMETEAQADFDRHGRPPKRADLNARCVQALGCTIRAAKSVRLPEHLRLQRGKPPRQPRK